MKRITSVFCFMLLVISGIILSSCIKENNGKTIALIGTEYYIDDILAVIPDSLQGRFDTIFEGYYEGAIPDSLGDSCSFVVNPNMLRKTNLSIPTPRQDSAVYMRFSNQHNGMMVMEFYEESLKKTDTVFVMGNNKDFTIYFVEDKSSALNHVKRGVVMCGTRTESGLADFRMVLVVLEAEGELAPTPGTYYYYEDGDGVASKCDWPWQ